MTGTEALAWAVIALAGAAIGTTSIGGVLVVPALSSLLGVPLPEAIAASSLAFLVTGAYALTGSASGALSHLRRDAPLMLTALLGAGAGAALTAWAPGDAVRSWIGLLALASGAHALWRLHRPDPRADHPWPDLGGQVALGLGVGLGSALSGTGGPVMLLPILMLMRRPLSRAIVAAQVIQMPIAIAASATHALAGRLDWRLGATIAVALLLGAWAGRRLARRANPRPLQAATAAVLLATGAWFLIA